MFGRAVNQIGLCLMAISLPTLSYAQGVYWETQCRSTSRTAPLACSATHSVFVQETGQLLLRVAFESRDGQAEYSLVILSALGFFLPNGIDLIADDELVAELEIQRCGAEGCFAATQLTQAQAEKMYQASSLKAQFSPSPQETAIVVLPVQGLADSLQLITR